MRLRASLGSVRILESETGSGKTEAALAYFIDLVAAGRVQGLYFALPTRTSAVQIHGRVLAAARSAFPDAPPPVLLAVPGYMRVDDQTGKLVDHRALWDDDRMAARGWFAENGKRYLAAPIAVGTIDQLLLGVLNGKHGSMRWAAAARSLLVVDEVHASDPYMSTLLEAVVRRHVRRGGHVLLMSATLGSDLARRCLNAANPGPYSELPALLEAVDLPYPLLRTVQPGQSVKAIAFPSSGREKAISLRILPIIDDPDAVAFHAAEHVRRGAKVLVIRNTVASCNAVHRRLERMLSPEQMMRAGPAAAAAPHHGRFAPEDRQALDEAVEATFGKGSPSRGVVLCATQTVEQSLDIDVDVLLTDLCPMDVLLQRIGRLHRHLVEGSPKPRPSGYERATVYVLVPAHAVADYAEKASNGIGLDRAYVDVRIACATLALIEANPEVSIPADNRRLVEMSSHPEALARIEESDPRLASYGMAVLGRAMAERDIAALGLRDEEWRHGDQLPSVGDGGRIATRLGLQDSVLPVDGSAVTALGLLATHVRIPAWLSPTDALSQDSVRLGPQDSMGTRPFELCGRSYSYGRCGLENGNSNELEPASRCDRAPRGAGG